MDLRDQQPDDLITKHALDEATREKTVDLLVESYPAQYRDITIRVLEKCGQNYNAKQLLDCEYCCHPRFWIRFWRLPFISLSKHVFQ